VGCICFAGSAGDYNQYATAYGYAPIAGQYAGYSILTDAGWITSESDFLLLSDHNPIISE
jgi:hypothetical protein